MRSLFTGGSRAAILLTGVALLAGCGAPATQAPTEDSAPATAESTAASVDCTVTRCVALTFDDGPGEYTDRLLDELADAHAPATFFMVGQNVSAYPEAVKRMVAEGHQLGSHTWDHADITTLTKEKIEHEVDWTETAIQEASGEKPTVLRPPYGEHGAVYDRLIPYPLVLWDVDTLDWQHHDPVKTVKIAMEEVQPGSIILMHDIHETSVEAVPDLVSELTDAGYTLVTVDQLFAGSDFEAGQAYTHGPRAGSADPTTAAS